MDLLSGALLVQDSAAAKLFKSGLLAFAVDAQATIRHATAAAAPSHMRVSVVLVAVAATALQPPAATRRAAVLGASAVIATSPLIARADTVQSICQKLEKDAPTRNAAGHPAEQLEVVVGAPGFDAWCPVEVSGPLLVGADHIDYLWLKDARTAASQRIYAARSFTGDAGIPRLTQNLKKGYVFKPMAYCSAHGLWEGEPIKV